MRKKAPGERYKTLTASIPPELYDAFVSRTERDRINKSDLVKTWVEAWLSGTPPTGREPSPGPGIDMDLLKQEIKADLLKSLPFNPKPAPEPEPEARKVTPDQAQLTLTPIPPEPGRPEGDSRGEERPVIMPGGRIELTEEMRTRILDHVNELTAAGMSETKILKAAFGKRNALITLMRLPPEHPKRQKTIHPNEIKAILSVVSPGKEKPSSEGI